VSESSRSSQRERLATSFDAVVDRYERGRFDYPGELVDALRERLDLRPGRRVLDLAAGTGKLTRQLVATGAEVVAVEPGEAMLAHLRETLPEAEAHLGRAEAIPLPDAAVDAVTVGSAFHWFRTRDALREIHRVLRRDGLLALVWNPIERDDAIAASLAPLLDRLWGKARPRAAYRDWRPVLTRSRLFAEPEEIRFAYVETVDADRLVDRILSVSAVAAAPPAAQAEIEQEVRRLVAERGGSVEVRTKPFAVVARRL
jgi:ubiquinone/menaquinone biosynthesis C-methylase UbiE